MILEKAHRLCGADLGAMITLRRRGRATVVSRGYSEAAAALVRGPFPPVQPNKTLIAGERYRHIPDVRAVEIGPDQGFAGGIVEITGLRTFLMVPLRKDGMVRGFLTAHRLEVRPFSEQDIALLESFAAQAVIAMENARLLGELQERTAALAQRNSEYGERIEHQAATIDVLKAMSASPGDPQPVFDLIVDRGARPLRRVRRDRVRIRRHADPLARRDGRQRRPGGASGIRSACFRWRRRASWACGRAILDRRIIRIDDMEAEPGFDPTLRGITAKSNVAIPLMRGDVVDRGDRHGQPRDAAASPTARSSC